MCLFKKILYYIHFIIIRAPQTIPQIHPKMGINSCKSPITTSAKFPSAIPAIITPRPKRTQFKNPKNAPRFPSPGT